MTHGNLIGQKSGDLVKAHRMALAGFLTRGVSHELNNPLTSIAGFSEGLLKRLKKMEDKDGLLSTFKDYLEIINAEAFRCQKIMDRLKDLATPPDDTQEPVRVDQAVRDTLVLIGQAAKDNGLTMDFDNRLPKEQRMVLGNLAGFKHILLTAFKALLLETGLQGHFSVSAQSSGTTIHVFIPDPSGQFTGKLQGLGPGGGLDGSPEVTPLMDLDVWVCYTMVQGLRGRMNAVGLETEDQMVELVFPALLP